MNRPDGTLAWLPGLAAMVSVADEVLFALYYRAVAFNANQIAATEGQR